MSRLWTGFVILLAILTFSLYHVEAVEKSLDKLEGELSRVQSFAEAGSFSSAAEQLSEVIEQWEKECRYIDSFLRGGDAENITDAMYDYYDIILSEDAAYLEGSYKKLVEKLRDISRVERISLENIL